MATVADLETRVNAQDEEIAQLKNAITEQDDAIEELQTQLDGSGIAELKKLLPGLNAVMDSVYGANVRPKANDDNDDDESEEVTNK